MSREETIASRQKKQKEKIINELKGYPCVSAVCLRVGINRATYYRWLQNDIEFKRKVSAALEDGVFKFNGIGESHILNGVQEGNMTSVIFWLKRRHESYMPMNRLHKKDFDDPEIEHDAEGN